MKKAELKNSLEAILNRNGIELSSTLAQELLGLAAVKAGGTKREFLPIKLSSYNDLDVLNEVVHNGVESFDEVENFLIARDVAFEVITDAIDVDSFYSLDNRFIVAYCVWFKEYRMLGQFSINKRSPNNIHHESKEAEIQWNEYGKRIKALEDDIIQIKNAVIDEVYTPAEGKVKISEIEAIKVTLEENRKNKVSLDDMLQSSSKQYQKGWKSKELMADYFNYLGVVITSDDTQEDEPISTQEEVQEAPKKSRKKK